MLTSKFNERSRLFEVQPFDTGRFYQGTVEGTPMYFLILWRSVREIEFIFANPPKVTYISRGEILKSTIIHDADGYEEIYLPGIWISSKLVTDRIVDLSQTKLQFN